jgi:hypothetical protein
MRTLFTNELLVVAPGEAASGIAGQPRMLRVSRGRAWVTMEGSDDDHWLGAGAGLMLPAARLVVVEADPAAGELRAAVERDRSSFAALAWRLRSLLQRLTWRNSGRSIVEHLGLV